MADYDSTIATAVDSLQSVRNDAIPDWDRVLRDAGVRRHAYRAFYRASVVVAVVVAGLAALPAVAGGGWWFLNLTGGADPQTPIATITSVGRAGEEWELTTYGSTMGQCVELSPRGLPSDQAVAGQGCGFGVIGEPGALQPQHKIGYVHSIGDAESPDYVFGLASVGVMRVAATLETGKSFDAATLRDEKASDLSLRFYVIQLPNCSYIASLEGFDSDGQVVERLPVGVAPLQPKRCPR